MARTQSRVTTDHNEIRRWAEERGARPASVRGTGGNDDVGILRLDFPGYSGQDSLQHIEWDEFFEKFDEQGLALLHQESTAGGGKSNFNKLVSRETAQQAERGRSSHRGASRSASARRSSSETGKKSSRTGTSRSRTKSSPRTAARSSRRASAPGSSGRSNRSSSSRSSRSGGSSSRSRSSRAASSSRNSRTAARDAKNSPARSCGTRVAVSTRGL